MPYCCIKQHVNAPGTVWCDECGSLIAGTVVDDYQIVSYLGLGSASTVYLAKQRSLNNRQVVMKVLLSSCAPEDVASVQQEAALLASLTHPYILPIYAHGMIADPRTLQLSYVPYLVLPHAEQGSLESAFEREGKRPWPLERVTSLIEEVADALDYAHGRGVLHRDIKPANLLLMGSHVVLADFGVSSLIDATNSHVNAPWAGTPAYMAPEVWDFSPGRYSDQYALAITAFRLLTGEHPWATSGQNSVRQWAHIHRSVAPRALRECRPDLPSAIDFVLQRALAKDPHARYPSVKEFASDLHVASLGATKLTSRETPREAPTLADPQPTFPIPAVEKKWQRSAHEDAPPAVQENQVHYANPNPTPPESRPPRQRNYLPPIQQKVLTSTKHENPPPTRQGNPVPARYENVTPAPLPPPLFLPASDAADNVPSKQAAQKPSRQNRWIWMAFVLNLLTCIILIAIAASLAGTHLAVWVAVATNLAFILWPSLLIGPLLARRFRRIPVDSVTWGIFWGVLFGILDSLLSTLFCYAVAIIALSIQQKGLQVVYSAQVLSVLLNQAVAILPQAVVLTLLGTWVTALGGAVIGSFNVRSGGARPSARPGVQT